MWLGVCGQLTESSIWDGSVDGPAARELTPAGFAWCLHEVRPQQLDVAFECTAYETETETEAVTVALFPTGRDWSSQTVVEELWRQRGNTPFPTFISQVLWKLHKSKNRDSFGSSWGLHCVRDHLRLYVINSIQGLMPQCSNITTVYNQATIFSIGISIFNTIYDKIIHNNRIK